MHRAQPRRPRPPLYHALALGVLVMAMVPIILVMISLGALLVVNILLGGM